LASDANSKAGDAKSDAGKARKETRRLDDLNTNIMELKNKIAIAQARLKMYSPASVSTPLAIPAPQTDTTQHP
jgi:hypothetical protein